jgi:preprotein translocase subunit SecA
MKVREFLKTDGVEDPNYGALLTWMNMTFPLRLIAEKAGFEKRTLPENVQFVVDQIRDAYTRKCSHEDPEAVRGLERYIVLNAVDRLWQEHLFGMDALREGIQLQRIGQKDPLVEYKNEAYAMFVELMTNIKFEVLNNLFRSTSNLQAFENFLASLPQTLLHETLSTPRPPQPGAGGAPDSFAPARHMRPAPSTSVPVAENGNGNGAQAQEVPELEIPSRRELPKVGRNEPCPCGSGKKFKNCCGRALS